MSGEVARSLWSLRVKPESTCRVSRIDLQEKRLAGRGGGPTLCANSKRNRAKRDRIAVLAFHVEWRWFLESTLETSAGAIVFTLCPRDAQRMRGPAYPGHLVHRGQVSFDKVARHIDIEQAVFDDRHPQ
jgi:hypothetical protein